jgi:hypothetical protein
MWHLWSGCIRAPRCSRSPPGQAGAPPVLLNETMVAISDLYRYSQRTNRNPKHSNALKHKPMMSSSFLEKFGYWFHIF